ncbi:MAG: DUF1194 domain-containing protein [Alphaproteobacteria bacterium]|nr:DUF1194 domain-containing protein [Alphaproteobacteria bacterium]
MFCDHFSRSLTSTLAGLALMAGAIATPAQACTTGLVLAIDVSNSIDSGEYRIQAEGLADALLDPEIREALVAGEVALTVIQWSGVGRQEITIPWRRMKTEADVLAISEQGRQMRRAFIMSDTAVGDIVRFSLRQFAAVPDCARHVIDISGDGTDNAGTDPTGARYDAEAQGVQINALAIEGLGVSISNFFRRRVITRDGFVMTARGHSTYAETLRRKIKREVSQVMF